MSSGAQHSTGHDDGSAPRSRGGSAIDAEDVLRQLPETVVCYDIDGRIVFVNEEFVARSGLPATDVVGKRPFEWADAGQSLIPDVHEYRRLLDEVLTTGEPRQIERVRPTPSGEPEVFQVLFRAARHGNGEIAGAFAIARNITDLARTRRMLDARERQFQALAENLPEVLIRFDTSGRVVYTNRHYGEQVGGPAIVGRLVDDLDPMGATGAGFQAAVRRALTAGEPGRVKVATRRSPAHPPRTHSILVQPEFAPDGSVSGAIAIGHDVTDLDEARVEAARSELRFRSLAEHLPDVVVRFDSDCRATYVNRSLGFPGGRDPGEMIGLTLVEVDGRLAGYERLLRDVVATGDNGSIMVSFADADGGERLYSVLIAPERSESGDVVGAISIARDVTDLVRAEHEAADRAHEFRTLAENLPDLVARYDLDARATYVNRTPDIPGMAGVDETVGLTPLESAPEGLIGIEQYEAALRRVLATGEAAATDLSFVDTAGRERVHSVLFCAERSASGSVVGAIAIGRDVTDLVLAHREIATREHQYRTLAENLPDLVLRYDLEGRATYITEQFATGANTNVADEIGTRPTEIQPPGMLGLEEYERRLLEVIATGEPGEAEIKLLDAHGEQRVHSVLIRAERDADHNICGALSIGRDVTDLVRAEEEAAARAREFLTLAENLPDIVLRYDVDGRTVYVNPQHDDQVNMARSELLGRRPTEIPFDGMTGVEAYEQTLMHVLATGHPAQSEIELTDRSGERRVHNVLFRAERSATGEIVGAIAIGRDVTDLVRAEEAAEARAREFRSLAENLPDLVIRYDLDARATYANQILPFPNGPSTAGELIGRTPLEVATHDLQGLDEYDRAVRRVLTTGESVTADLVFTDAAQEEHVRSVVLAPERNSDGAIVGAISIGRDVTDLVQAQRSAAAREREFRSLAENATDFIGRWDREARRIYTNPALARLMGKRPEDLIGHVADGGPDGVFNDFVAAVRATIEEQTERTVLQRFVDPDGEERIHEVKLLPEHDEHGEFVSVLGVGRDITDVIRQREALEEAARTDALTGVASRKVLYEALPALLDARAAEGHRLALLLLDLDGFKTINDQHGHWVGDQLLRQIAARLTTCLGPDDMLVRVGGDEFVIVLGDAQEPTDASVLAHQARMLVTELRADGPVRFPAVDASVGIAVFPDHGDDTDVLFAHADLALYEAKRAGRGRVHFFHAELRDAMERRAAIEQALYECVPDTEMSMHLQPICTLGADPHVWGAEALVRWNHPRLGSVSPAEFIPIAEHSGEIVPIGRWVLRRAAELAVALNTGRPRPLRVSVNVSTRQFTLDDIAEATRSSLEATGCDPRWLILEITENLLLEDLPLVDRTLESLRSLGVSIAIDDFGTGYSSLHYLTRLRVDHMKVDKSFVRDADVDHQQQEIVRALVAMAQALGIEVVAEGIETPGQACLLEQLGCRLGQGYLLARPMPVDQFTSWLTDAHATLRAALPA